MASTNVATTTTAAANATTATITQTAAPIEEKVADPELDYDDLSDYWANPPVDDEDLNFVDTRIG